MSHRIMDAIHRLMLLLTVYLAAPTLHHVTCDDHTPPPKLLLISMDSLMYDFIKDLPPENRSNFDHIIQNGVFAQQIMNVFPTSTYPNHYTLLTGLYPESHGLVSNIFYDPDLDAYFSLNSPKDNVDTKWFDVGAEPIYVTNARAGQNRKTGVVLFPTGMANVKGVAPDIMIEDDGTYPSIKWKFPYVSMPFRERVDKMVGWFTDKQNPVNLGLLYFPEPDEESHAFGPASEEVRSIVGGPLNDALGYLLDQLREAGLLESMNIILTADHGQTTFRKFAILNDYIDPDSYTTGSHLQNGIDVGIYPLEPGKEEEIVANLTKCPDVNVMKKGGAVSMAMNYARSNRIAPVIVEAKLGVIIRQNKSMTENFKTVGHHGYDPAKYASMRPLFMAMGPGFKKGVKSPIFHLTDVYPMMCHLLGVTPAPNNGSLDNVRHLMATDVSGNEGLAGLTYIWIGGVLTCLAARSLLQL